jgi:coenzyme F420-reducing hydrogenase gamma subunit
MLKRCCDCQEEKALDSFHKQPGVRDGRRGVCKPCAVLRATKWRQDNPERFNAARRKREIKKYGITYVDYERMLAEQAGVCLGCKTLSEGEHLAVDHCHATGRVRGLLCRNCNLTLGNVQDKPEVLRALADYLDRY